MHFPDSLPSLGEADPVRLVRNAIRRVLDAVKNPSSEKALGLVLCAALAVGGASGCATVHSAVAPQLPEAQTQEVVQQPETPPQAPIKTDEDAIRQQETPPPPPTKSEPEERPRSKKGKRKKPGDSKRALV